MTINGAFIIILLGGWIFSKGFKKIYLPSILGMVVFGILGSLFLKESFPPILWQMESSIKSLALVVILLRAGLGISPKILGKAGRTALWMAFLPCFLEAAALFFPLMYFFQFSWPMAGLTAFMLAAVSPAVIVPSMLDFIEKGYGGEKAVPSIVLGGASLDDVLAITAFSAFLSLNMEGQSNVAGSLVGLPISILGGIVLGIIAGLLLVFILKKYKQRIRATEKALILLTLGMLLVEVGEWLHIASLLCVMTLGFILLLRTQDIALELSHKFSKIWIFAEIFLFVLIGLSLDVPVAVEAGLKGILLVLFGLVFRSLGVLLATLKSGLSWRERLFCVVAYLPKATVQAALGGVALSFRLPQGNVVLALAVIAILLTAPMGLLGIRWLGPKLLGKPLENPDDTGI